MALAYSTLPANITGTVAPFGFHVSNRNLLNLGGLLSVSQIPPPSYYINNDNGTLGDGEFGISRKWLVAAKNAWLDDFDWHSHEAKINSYPNYKINITTEEGGVFNTHFAALFSKKPNAVPVIFMHGWPGSYMEFFPMLDLLVQKYTPDTLPYHVIVPSIPDYGFSSGPSKNVELTFPLAGEVMNKLMISLGFTKYIAQGGDVGSFMATQMCGTYDECRAFHREFSPPLDVRFVFAPILLLKMDSQYVVSPSRPDALDQ